MAKIENKVFEHSYDGIEEYDNPLPPWWVTLFIVTVIWGVVYIFYYHIFGFGDSSTDEYNKEVAVAGMISSSGGSGMKLEKADFVFLKDDNNLQSGKAIFIKNCVACHAPDGGGGVGPNLTDKFWLHGGSFENIATTIMNGVPEKGMITWKNLLKKEEILQVTSYIISLQGTTPDNPKAQQGDIYEGKY